MEFRTTRRKCLVVFLVGFLFASAGCSSAGAAVSGAVYEDSHCVVSNIELEVGDEGDFYLHGSVKNKEDVEDSFNGTVTLLDDEGEGVGMAYFSCYDVPANGTERFEEKVYGTGDIASAVAYQVDSVRAPAGERNDQSCADNEFLFKTIGSGLVILISLCCLLVYSITHQDKELNRKVRYNGYKYTCPMCGSHDVKTIGTAKKLGGVAAVGLASSNIGKCYQCDSCNYKW